MTRPRSARPPRGRGDTGTGVISMAGGVIVFLVLVLFATHLAFGLHARTVITAETYEAARDAARYAAGGHSCAAAVDRARAQIAGELGALGDAARVDGGCAGGVVRLSVSVTPPRLLPARWAEVDPLGVYDRTVEVRVEELQP